MRSNPLRLVVSLTAVIVAVIPVFTSGSPITTEATPSSSDDEWIFRTTTINTTSFQAEPYVSNGYIGARLPAEGMGLRIHPAIDYEDMNGTQGWPLFSLRQTASIVAGFYGLQDKTRGTNFVNFCLFCCLSILLSIFHACHHCRIPRDEIGDCALRLRELTLRS